jgi:hypothetical protein
MSIAAEELKIIATHLDESAEVFTLKAVTAML